MARTALPAALLVFCFATSLPAAEQWTRVTTPNFELYTPAGEKTGRDAALHFEQIRAFFAQASPVKPPGDSPLRIIAFSTAEQYRAYTANPLSAAYFVSGAGHDYIVMQDAGPESYSIAVHEYVHFVIRHSGLRVPLWLSEGWADVYSSMRPVRDGMAVGDLIPGRMRALEAAKGAWFDFSTLTSVGPGSSIYNEGERTGLFYAESWALAHMFFLSPEYRDNFGKFLLALHKGSPAPAAAQSAFGKSAPEVFADARGYFDRRKLVGTVFQTSMGKAESAPSVTVLNEFDSRLVLADLRAASGRPDVAWAEYERLEKMQPERADLQQSMGYLFWTMHDNPWAKSHLAKAFELGGRDPRMCYTLATLQMATAEAVPKTLASLECAVAGAPGLTDALVQLGIARALARQFEGAKEALLRVQTITSDKAAAVYYALASAYLHTGDMETARTHLTTAGKYAKRPADIEALQALRTLLEAREKSVFAPRTGETIVRAEGQAVGADCGPQGQKLRFNTSGGQSLILDLPATAAVEIIHEGPGELSLQCGAFQPVKAVIEYAQGSVLRPGTAGVLRSLQF